MRQVGEEDRERKGEEGKREREVLKREREGREEGQGEEG